MATLNIGGKRVKVDDAFLSMTPEQQNATVEEIAGQIGLSAPQGQPGEVANPGQAYGDLMASSSARSQKWGSAAPAPLENNLATSTAATISGIVNGIPVIGPLAQNASDNLMGIGSQLTGGDYGQTVKGLQDRRQQIAQAAPIADVAGNVAGNVASFGAAGATKLGADALGMTGKFLPGVLKAGLSNQAVYTADQMARGNSGTETLGNGVPFLVGAGSRVAGEAIDRAGQKVADVATNWAQKRLTNAVVTGAQSADELKAASTAMFKSVDESGVTVNTNKFSEFVAGLVSKAKGDRINPSLDPKAFEAYREMIGALDDVQRNGASLTISDLHTLRQIAQKAAVSAEGRDAMFAGRIVDGIDDFITRSGNLSVPTNQIGDGSTEAGSELLKAISTWGKAKRTGVIEEAIYRAQNQASGLENGLRTQFRAILQNAKKRAMFSKAEIQAIEQVANGDAVSNLAKLVGKFGFGSGGATNMIGGTIGFGAGSMTPLGPLGGIMASMVGTGARKASEKMTEAAARRAAQVVATGNIPIAQQMPNLLAPVARPVDLLLRGSGNAATR